MCRFGLLEAIVSDNGTQFSSAMVTKFYRDLGIQIKFIYVIHLQANGQTESANKVILKGRKKKLDDAKGIWVELLHGILWSYHTTPHFTTKETPFVIV